MRQTSILDCLAAVGDEDPTEDIFNVLFEAEPELRAVFVLDRSGDVRRAMLQNCFEIIVDYASGGSAYVNQLIGIYFNHAAYDTTREQFLGFFGVIGIWLKRRDPVAWCKARDAWLEMETMFSEIVPAS